MEKQIETGQGLLARLESEYNTISVSDYKSLSKDELKEKVKDFFSIEQSQPRQYVIHTGRGGMNMFNEAMSAEVDRMERQNNLDLVDFLMNERHAITEHEGLRLKQMINAGAEDYDLAKEILTAKMHEFSKDNRLPQFLVSTDPETRELGKMIVNQITSKK